jgi:transcriptional regulator with XRE-family HTH domain
MSINVLGSYIRERRQHLGLTQEQLAAQIGGDCRQSDISRIECGHIRVPESSMMDSLAAALDVSLGNLPIAPKWGEQPPIAAVPPSGDSSDAFPRKDILAEIDTELDAIQDLERQAASRSQQLRRTLRELDPPPKRLVSSSRLTDRAFRQFLPRYNINNTFAP